MSLTGLLILFIGLPTILFIGIQLEMSRRHRKYKNEEKEIQGKYQDNLFVLEPRKNEIGEESEKSDIKKAS